MAVQILNRRQNELFENVQVVREKKTTKLLKNLINVLFLLIFCDFIISKIVFL